MGNMSHPNMIWIDIKKQIEYAIIDGTYKSASKMPSIAEVSEIFSCSKSTAQKVLEEMYNEGTITRQKGVGYFVKPLMREKILEKYMNVWEIELTHCIKEAFLLGLSIKTLDDYIEEKKKSVYSR